MDATDRCISAAHRKPAEKRTPCEFLTSVQSSWGGKAEDSPRSSWGRPIVTKPVIKNYDCYHNRLKDTTILRSDYKPIMRKYDSPSTVFLVDPPYPQTKKEYTNYGTGIPDLRELRDIIAERKGCVIASLPNTAEVRKLFREPAFDVKPMRVRNSFYPVLRSQGATRAKPSRTELLIRNKRCLRMGSKKANG